MLEEKINCDNCQNQEICKWCFKFNQTVTDVNKISNEKVSPIAIVIVCNKFVRTISHTQDIFFNQSRQV